MEISPDIRIITLPGVYEPSDDSYLLIESIIVSGGEVSLDMGCGTGVVAIHMAKNGCEVTAVDADRTAIRNTLLNAELNKVKIKCIESNLFKNVDGRFDIIAFNPPYLPVENEYPSWSGGAGGIEIIKKFLEDAWRYLNEDGKIYMVASSLTDVDSVIKKFKGIYSFKLVKKRHFFFEDIYVFEIMANKSL